MQLIPSSLISCIQLGPLPAIHVHTTQFPYQLAIHTANSNNVPLTSCIVPYQLHTTHSNNVPYQVHTTQFPYQLAIHTANSNNVPYQLHTTLPLPASYTSNNVLHLHVHTTHSNNVPYQLHTTLPLPASYTHS